MYSGADGTYLVDANVTASNTFSYTGKFYYSAPNGSIFDITRTQGFQAYPYSNSAIANSAVISSVTAGNIVGGTSGNLITVITSVPHGLSLGNEVGVTGLTGTNPPNGSWVVQTIANSSAFSYFCNAAPTGAITTTTANIYARPLGLTVHRPTQAGIRFSVNDQSHNNQYIRQTRRYFRYQSGKGIQMSTGTTLMPNMYFDSITASSTQAGAVITATTKDPHNIWTNLGMTVNITGCNEAGFNGTFPIASVITPYQFTYIATTAPTTLTASGLYTGAVTGWYGSGTRIGLFDHNNGVFFEFDGQTLWAVRRSATFNLSGGVSVASGSPFVTGINSLFSKQLQPNDFITIKGMTYRILNINSDTSMTINPAYRGASNITNAIYTKVTDTRIPQSSWNIDRCDGTGPSGFNLNLAKNQMMYIDYSWYGAGHIRYGFRGTDGSVIYCHKIINNNVNNVAYMRSGNLPARYETHSFTKTGIITANIASSDTIINVNDTYQWPPSGTIVLRNTNQQEYINYSGSTQVQQATFTYQAGYGNLTLISGNTANVYVGQYVNGPFIPYNTTVQSFVPNVSVVLNNAPTGSTNANGLTLNFGPQLIVSQRGQAGATATGVQITANNTILSNLTSTANIQPGQFVFGPGIPNQSLVTSVGSSTVTLSIAPFFSTGSATVSFVPMTGNATPAQTFTYSNTAPTAVELHAPTFSSEINHWGTSAIMDGGFTNDKQYIFTKGMTSFANIYPGQSNAIMSFRIAPSASQGIPGSAPGLRDQINHMQLIPYELDAYSNGSFLMSVVINGTPLASNNATDTSSAFIPAWQNVGGSSLSQYIFHNANTTVTGGETIFGFYMNTTGFNVAGGPGIGNTYNTTQQDFSQVKDLGTSILGGGTTAGNIGIYPDGPETLTLIATNISPGTPNTGFYKANMANLVARFSWTEAQA